MICIRDLRGCVVCERKVVTHKLDTEFQRGNLCSREVVVGLQAAEERAARQRTTNTNLCEYFPDSHLPLSSTINDSRYPAASQPFSAGQLSSAMILGLAAAYFIFWRQRNSQEGEQSGDTSSSIAASAADIDLDLCRALAPPHAAKLPEAPTTLQVFQDLLHAWDAVCQRGPHDSQEMWLDIIETVKDIMAAVTFLLKLKDVFDSILCNWPWS